MINSPAQVAWVSLFKDSEDVEHMGRIQYEIISVIKESNKGNVYLASVEGYSFPVIVKRLKKGNRKVFEALQTVKNEHVPQIYCLEEESEGLLIAEEYIEGELLSEYLKRPVLSEAEYLSIAEQLCEGLEILHQCEPPLIHRDVKPSNIIVNSEGVVKIIDFDSSRQYKEESENDTRLLGTEKYAAPEQYGFSQTDCRSDIYSLGVVFGSFPEFSSKGRRKRWKKLVEKCTLFAPESRFQTVTEVKRELRKVRNSEKIRWGKICVTVAGLLLLGGICLTYMSDKTPDTEKTPTPEPTEEKELIGSVTPEPEPTGTMGLSPIEELDPTPSPEPSPTPSPSPTTEPSQTPCPSPAATPSPSPTPTEEPQQDTSFTQEEAYRTTAPEWRDIAGEPETYVTLKQQIRDNRYVVVYCFKDRLGERDFMLQTKELLRPDAEYYGVRLYSHLKDEWMDIDERYVEVKDGIVHIDRDYMKALADGYYKISVRIRRTGESWDSECGVLLYVAESDVLEESGWWLQNTTFTYYGEEGERINVVVNNDSGMELAGLLHRQQEVDEALYRIRSDGRVLEFSEELLRSKSNMDLVLFQVVGADGSRVDVQITNVAEE